MLGSLCCHFSLVVLLEVGWQVIAELPFPSSIVVPSEVVSQVSGTPPYWFGLVVFLEMRFLVLSALRLCLLTMASKVR